MAMMQLQVRSSEVPPGFHSSVAELTESTQRTMVYVTLGVYFVCHVVATATWPTTIGRLIWPVTAIVACVCALTLLLLPKRLLVAHTLYQIGLAGAITLALYLFRKPEIVLFYALLPFMAAVVAGWQATLLAVGFVGFLVLMLASGLTMPGLSPGYGFGVVLGGIFTGLLGLASSHSLITAVHWSFYNFKQAQQNMEEARQHRAQLMRLLKDLDQAYYQLERANSALVAARKGAEDAERFKSEFVANVSHELRTPLNLIVGFTEMMATSPESYDNVELPGPYRSDINAVYHSAQHLLTLVDDVLDLARIEAGKIALARDEVDPHALIAEAVDVVRDYIAAKGLDLYVEVDREAPKLWVDRLRIRQTLLNLLVNAARHTQKGRIGVRLYTQGSEVIIEVTDTGPGIPKQDLPKIFQEFRSTEQPTSDWHSGTGLGLPISKKFVELHHGRIGVESTQGQGTRFWFTLPALDSPDERTLPDHRDRYQPIVRLGATERIVVVVHEDPRIIPLLKRHISGYQMVGTADLDEGIALAEQLKAVAILSDNEQICSLSLANTIAIHCPLPNARQAAIALGAQDLLVKPVSRHELLAAVDRLNRPLQNALIVDDDPKLVRLFRRMLRGRIPVQHCWEAYNGKEALHLMHDRKPDLVLLDLVMPEVDGKTLLAQMTADPSLADIPVILISARGTDQTSLQLSGIVQIARHQGFDLGESMGLLESVLNKLTPGWQALTGDEKSEPEEAQIEILVLADRQPPQA